MYAGRVACCSLVSHGEYADGTDRQMDKGKGARPLLLFPPDTTSVIMDAES